MLCHLMLPVRQVGARGADEQGAIFASSLKRSSVDVKKLRVGRGITGQSCALAFLSSRVICSGLLPCEDCTSLPSALTRLAYNCRESQNPATAIKILMEMLCCMCSLRSAKLN